MNPSHVFLQFLSPIKLLQITAKTSEISKSEHEVGEILRLNVGTQSCDISLSAAGGNDGEGVFVTKEILVIFVTVITVRTLVNVRTLAAVNILIVIYSNHVNCNHSNCNHSNCNHNKSLDQYSPGNRYTLQDKTVTVEGLSLAITFDGVNAYIGDVGVSCRWDFSSPTSTLLVSITRLLQYVLTSETLGKKSDFFAII